MAKIKDELILEDKFTKTFTNYISLADRAAGSTNATQKATQRFAEANDAASRATGTLAGKVKQLAGAYLGLQGVKSLLGMSDMVSTISARLNLMNDGLQTTAQLNDMIAQSAQRARASYADTASFVAKLGTLAGNAFSSNRELIAFAEQVNKQMKISGTSAQEAQDAMLQLSQAMSSGVLRGDELRSVMEETPMIAQTIAKYMGVTVGEMRNMAADGAVTADIVKNAMLSAADETNQAFQQIPRTWGDIWNSVKNTAIIVLEPVLQMVSWIANNMDIIAPLVLAAATAFGVYAIAAYGATAATSVWTAVQAALNAVMAMNPVMIVVMAIVLLVGVLYAAVAAYNKFTGSTVSATGILAGAFMVAVTFVGNLLNAFFNLVIGGIAFVANEFIDFANFIGNVFTDPVGSIVRLFSGMADNVLGILQSIASAIDAIFGSNLSSAVQGWRGSLKGAVEKKFGSGTEYFKKIQPEFGQHSNYGDAWNKGYSWGSNFKLGGVSNGMGNSGIGGIAPAPYSGVQNALDNSKVAKSVGNIEKSVAMSEEDIKMLADLAERRYVNNINLTAQTPIINVSGQNTGDTAADRKRLGDTIRDILLEQVSSSSQLSTATATQGG